MSGTTELATDQEGLSKDKQLPPRDTINQTDAERKALMDYAEAQLRKLSASRGLDWDRVSDEERIYFVDDLIHEDRACKR